MTTDIVASPEINMLSIEHSERSTQESRSREAVAHMRRYAELSGLPMVCFDTATNAVVAQSGLDLCPEFPVELTESLSDVGQVSVYESASGILFYGTRLPGNHSAPMAAVGYSLTDQDVRPEELILAAAQQNWSQSQLNEWFQQRPICSSSVIESLLRLTVERAAQDERETSLTQELEQLGDQINSTYEEISLLHALTQNLQISRSPAELATMCIDRLHSLIGASGTAIWIQNTDGSRHFLVEGNIPFDELGMARLIARFDNHDWSKPFVKNAIEGTLLGADFPGLKNLVVVPIAEGPFRSGWILGCNPTEGRDFGTVEGSLLNSIATILGTHVRNIDLYEQHDQLLLSFVRSLVSTLDAKDHYTCGHSERVALIARRLGHQLGLPDEDLQDIYLSGLLHDIGKIGVNDWILRKPDSLDDDEFAEIQKHPMIGYQILHQLKNLQHVLPGVRSHHETYSGAGYPDGLAGEDIPMMARIIAVADAYDAMGSDRPYRKGLPLDKIEQIFRRGANDQWDERVIEAYFTARDDITRICDDHSPGGGNAVTSRSCRAHHG